MITKQRYPVTKANAVILDKLLDGVHITNQAQFNDSILQHIMRLVGTLEGALKYSGTTPSEQWDQAVLNHSVGQLFVVEEAGTYVNEQCGVGDLIICNTSANYAADEHWNVIHTNMTGAIANDGDTTTIDNLVTFANTAGSLVKDSGIGISSIEQALSSIQDLYSKLQEIPKVEFISAEAYQSLKDADQLVEGTLYYIYENEEAS